MYFSFGKHSEKPNSLYFEVEIGPQAETTEGLIRKIFKVIGLVNDYQIKAFDKFVGNSFFRAQINNAATHQVAIDAIKKSNGQRVKVSVRVYPEVVEDLKRFGINLKIATGGKATFNGYSSSFEQNIKKTENERLLPLETPIEKMTTLEKIGETIKRAIFLLPEDVGKELLALLDPVALAIVAGVLVVWAASHFFGVGEVVDVILIIVGVISLGPIAWKAGGHLIDYATTAVNAKNEEDLNIAARHLSEAIALIGVQVVMALLLKKAPKAFREPRNQMGSKLSTTLTMETIGVPPETPGSIFYKPKTTIVDSPFPAGKSGGVTNQWGDVTVMVSKVTNEAAAALIHEKVHRFFTAKLQMFPKLRQFRAVLKTNSYLKSYILRYLEEALAETIAQVRVNGWENLIVGLKFPLKEGYVTVAKMGTEALGILLGPINVSGMVFNVYYAYSDTSAK